MILEPEASPPCPTCYWGGSQGCCHPTINSILDADPYLASRVHEMCSRYNLFLPERGMSRSTGTRAAALKYARRGWPVVPIHTPGGDGLCTCGKVPCDSAGKHPRTPGGVKDATGKKRTCSLSMVDSRSGGLESLAELEGALSPASRDYLFGTVAER